MSTAQDLDLHSESEGEDPGAAEGYEVDEEEDTNEDEDKEEPEEPIVLKTWVGFVRNNSNKNSPSPTLPEESKEQNNDANGSATGIPHGSIHMASHRLNTLQSRIPSPKKIISKYFINVIQTRDQGLKTVRLSKFYIFMPLINDAT